MMSRQNHDIGRDVVGFVVNCSLSDSTRRSIANLQAELDHFEPGLLWSSPPESLHVTLLDWIAPLVRYSTDPATLYQLVSTRYDRWLNHVLTDEPPIDIVFNEVVVSPDAVVVKARDSLPFERIREAFVVGAGLPPMTKRPPRIVHATICRFLAVRPIEALTTAAGALSIEITDRIEAFRLIRETRTPMLEFDVLKTYSLSGGGRR